MRIIVSITFNRLPRRSFCYWFRCRFFGSRHLLFKVSIRKGFTIAGLNEMEHQGFSSSLIKGITTSYNKIV